LRNVQLPRSGVEHVPTYLETRCKLYARLACFLGLFWIAFCASARSWDASLAAWIPSSQYPWCSPVVDDSLLKLHSRRNRSSSSSPFGPRASWCSISLSRLALCTNIRTPVVQSWTSMHLYIHCVCVTCSSWVIKPAIHCIARYDSPVVWKCVLWIARSLVEIIPMTKLSHPMMSWEIAYSQTIGGRFKWSEHLAQVIEPRPRRYWRSRSFMLGCVPLLSIHFSTSVVDCKNATARPVSGY
jgi:hypothetical protein